MKQETINNHASRKITTTYTLDNNYRVKVYTYHSKESKSLRSIVSECIARIEENYSMETHMMFRDFNERIISEHLPRYSLKALEDQHAKAIEQAAQTVALLLAEGENGQRECQKVAA